VVIETTDSHLVDSDPVDLGWILAVSYCVQSAIQIKSDKK